MALKQLHTRDYATKVLHAVCVFAKEPIREQEIKLGCMSRGFARRGTQSYAHDFFLAP